ncbi:ShET2/EspL2 family type III secretion system effector toxin [uncultured Endozoicomonas sp.]|uniref:ShET2/EspL2 family type III secretion system effector toxin n=1 Tax=uncultured Endozoicomonas sp. TaxID=432652 RepID=UPI00262D460A|nr:ShET2/EspL2 family type III secretion system effector toxin [uncultured Endozoicomonas sp.]
MIPRMVGFSGRGPSVLDKVKFFENRSLPSASNFRPVNVNKKIPLVSKHGLHASSSNLDRPNQQSVFGSRFYGTALVNRNVSIAPVSSHADNLRRNIKAAASQLVQQQPQLKEKKPLGFSLADMMNRTLQNQSEVIDASLKSRQAADAKDKMPEFLFKPKSNVQRITGNPHCKISNLPIKNTMSHIPGLSHRGNTDAKSANDDMKIYQKSKMNDLSAEGRKFELIRVDNNHSILAYYSSDNPLNLNCEVYSADSSLIKCRHLAESYMNGGVDKGKNKFEPFSTEEALTGNQNIPTDADLDVKYDANYCKEAYYFQVNDLPKALNSASEDLWDQPEGSEKKFSFFSSHHAMSIILKRAHGGVIVNLYNPNSTNRHWKLLLPHKSCVSKLTAKQILPRLSQKEFVKDNSVVLMSNEIVVNQSDCQVSHFGELNSEIIDQMLKYGHYGHDSLSMVRNQGVQANKPQKDHFGGLEFAVFHRKHDAVQAYLKDRLDCVKNERELLSELLIHQSVLDKMDKKTLDIYYKTILSSKLTSLSKRRSMKMVEKWARVKAF